MRLDAEAEPASGGMSMVSLQCSVAADGAELAGGGMSTVSLQCSVTADEAELAGGGMSTVSLQCSVTVGFQDSRAFLFSDAVLDFRAVSA